MKLTAYRTIACIALFLEMHTPARTQLTEKIHHKLDGYNVVWNTQSNNSAGSMPCGGGDIGLNVWVEKGDVLFYMSESGMFDENNQLLKAGRVRLQLSSNPFAGKDFKQTLQLTTGAVSITGNNTRVLIWVDVFRPVIHVAVESSRAITIKTSYESWRYRDHIIRGTEFRANSYRNDQEDTIITSRDSVAFINNAVLFYHRNNSSTANIFDKTVSAEGMDAVKTQLFDPVTNNTFGGMMQGTGMSARGTASGSYAGTDYKSWNLQTNLPVRTAEIIIGLHTAQVAQPLWLRRLVAVIKDAAIHSTTAAAKTLNWWANFWSRSYIFIDGKDSFVSRNYQLFRYQLACNAYGKWPTKFNGGLFTFDPMYVDPQQAYSPDFRLWGGGTMTAQNQRLVYFPMIKSGDADMMKPQFDFYLHILHNAELRSKVYWNHPGACFTEQIENFGLPNLAEYGIKRPQGSDPGIEYNPWLEYLWETVFEFCFMIMETERYEHADIKAYIPLIESCLVFYDEHYRQLALMRGVKPFDEEGRYILYPGSAAETFKMTYNSTTVISALKVVLTRMLELPDEYVDSIKKQKWDTMLKRIPDIPLRMMNGHEMLAPATAWSRVQNSETPQLYPVFPWGIYGVDKPGLNLATNTYWFDTLAVKFRSYIGWKQDNIFAARLGLTDEAVLLTRQKFNDATLRFPTFWGPGFDWTPDHNWGGTAMIGLQEMLLQADGKKIILLPAWPQEWSGSFKLHAPYNTTVEATITAGKISNLLISPKERLKDITIAPPGLQVTANP